MYNEIKDAKSVRTDLMLGVTNPLIVKVTLLVTKMHVTCVAIRPRIREIIEH